MSVRPSTWGAIAGTVVALAVLMVISLMLLHSGGANYKVLVAPWLWLLPVTGFFAGLGYAAGRIIEMLGRAKTSARREPYMKTLDDIGATIERQLDNVELRFGQHPLGSLVFGALLALGVIAGGLAAFIVVFVVLVRFFS